MRVDRLRMLLRVGERVRREQLPFDMRVWVWVDCPHSEDGEPEEICGSAGCIIGWAARDPEVMATGLHLCSLAEDRAAVKRMEEDPGLLERDERAWLSLQGMMVGSPLFGEFCGLHAVAEWLECADEADVRMLVLPDYYDASPHDVPVEDVIVRLRETIAWHKRQLVPGAES